MPEWLPSVIVAFIVSGLGFLGQLLATRKSVEARKKEKADLAEQFRLMGEQLVTDLEKERAKRRALEKRFDLFENYITCLLEGIKILISQLEDARIVPRWSPPKRPSGLDSSEIPTVPRSNE